MMLIKYYYLDNYRPDQFEMILNEKYKEGFRIIYATSRYIILGKSENPSERF